MEIELKACPFCGSNDLATETVDHIDYQRIYCDQCSARGPVEDCVGNYRRPAIAWNKAHAAEAKLAKVRVLRDEVNSFMRSPQKKDHKERAWELGNCINNIKNDLSAILENQS